MSHFRKLFAWLHELRPISKTAIKLGAGLMSIFYIVGISSYLSAPYVNNYYNALALFRGCLEAAPACLVVGVCAGLLGDLMLSRNEKKDE